MASSTSSSVMASNKQTDPAAAASRLRRIYLTKETAKEMWFAVVASLVFVLTVVRIVGLLVTRYRKSQLCQSQSSIKEASETGSSSPGQTGTGRASLRRIPQAITAAFRIAAFRTTIPIGTQYVVSIADLSIVVVYYIAIFSWEFTRTDDQGKELSLRFWCDRAAHIAGAQINLVIALAGKNNVISFLTGISHEKLNVIHRAASRAILILFWVHGIGRYALGLENFHYFETTWMRAGVMALTSLTLTAVVSLRPIRNAFFEFFLISHIITVVIFIAGGIVHRPETKDYFWPGLLIWGFDRSIRVGRIFFFNMRWWRKADKFTTAHVELVEDNTVRLTMRRPMTWRAGQHAYIVMPSVSTFPFEAHPFSISSISSTFDGTSSSDENDLVFLIRGRNGFTRRLREHATNNGHGSVPALVDGPYGYPPDLTTFTTCIFVAGGSGITYTLPLFLDAVRNARAGSSAVTRIVFIWAIRNAADLKWISSTLASAIAAAPEYLVIEPRIYVTRANGALPALTYNEDDVSVSSSEGEKKKSVETLLNILRAEAGRPDLRAGTRDRGSLWRPRLC